VLDVSVPQVTFTLTVAGPLETTELNAAVEQAADYVLGDYTTSSWAELAEAVASGQSALTDSSNLNQEDIDALTTAIMDAIGGLAERGDTTLLGAVLSALDSLALSVYTSASADALTQAMSAAQAIVNDNSDSSQARVDDALALVQSKVAALQPKVIADIVDTTTLVTIIEVAAALDPDDYTLASFAVLTSRLQAAQQLLAETNPSQTRVDAATQALALSIESLVPATKTPYKKVGTPTVSGTAKVGKTLKAKPGTWSPKPTSYSYQWYRDGERIAGATQTSYTLTAADQGHKVTVKARGHRIDYAETWSHSSKAKKIAAGSLTAKTPKTVNLITGKDPVKTAPKYGEVLQAIPGAWGPVGVTLTYQWYRSGKAIVGATGDTYTLTLADVGKKMKVKVSGALDGYKSTSKTSKQSKAVGKLSFATATPAIFGTPQVGQSMTVVMNAWTPVPDTISYQWYRSGKAIKGATSATYLLTSSDKGKYMTVKVSGATPGFSTASKTSAKTAKVIG
jgi:ATP-dependent Clp protease adapter protein ClpS